MLMRHILGNLREFSMLIEFSVSNFRSIREKQTLLMTAAPRLGKKENTFKPSVNKEKLPDLLKVAAIYGGNASGKTTLIVALGMIQKLATRNPDPTNNELPIRAFRFDPELLNKPSIFDIHFIAARTRYQFTLAVNSNRIIEETLVSYPGGKEELLYSRKYDNDRELYEFGDLFQGDKTVRTAWRNLTSPQSLFISQAVANSSEELKQLRIPHAWLTNGLLILDDGPRQLFALAGEMPFGTFQKNFSEEISKFLRDVDVPVTEIIWEKNSDSNKGLESASEKALRSANSKSWKTTLTHKTDLGSATFDLSEESSGTRNLIGFWFPSMMLTRFDGKFKDLDSHGVVAVDELDSSLHPEVVERIVEMHIKSGANTQLIFTTHDTHLMKTGLLRRDQLWLTDRNRNGATKLTSVHSFKGRESEDVEKRYFEGRYNGLPFLSRS
jgi:AAA15 family ATPase/GTPase